MKAICHYCGELKDVQRILGKDNELRAGYMSKEPRKYIDVCKECIKKQGGIVKIRERENPHFAKGDAMRFQRAKRFFVVSLSLSLSLIYFYKIFFCPRLE